MIEVDHGRNFFSTADGWKEALSWVDGRIYKTNLNQTKTNDACDQSASASWSIVISINVHISSHAFKLFCYLPPKKLIIGAAYCKRKQNLAKKWMDYL